LTQNGNKKMCLCDNRSLLGYVTVSTPAHVSHLVFMCHLIKVPSNSWSCDYFSCFIPWSRDCQILVRMFVGFVSSSMQMIIWYHDWSLCSPCGFVANI